MTSRRPLAVAAALGTVYLVWGSTYLAIHVANETLPPLLMLSARFLLAGGILYAWSWRRGHLAAGRPGRAEWRSAALIGLALLVVDTGGVAWAQQRVASGTAALLVASVPLFMLLLDRLWFGTRIPLGGAAGIVTGLLGVALLVGPSGGVDPLGAAVILVASLAWAAGSLYARIAPLPRQPLLAASMQMLCAGVMLAGAGIVSGEAGRVHLSSFTPSAFGAVGYLVVFGSLVAYTVYLWLVRSAPLGLVSTYAYVNPAVAVVLGWLFAGERLGGRELAAGAVVLGSVALLGGAREPRPIAVPIAESLQPYIRRQSGRVAEFPRAAPRMADLRRIAA